MLIVYSAIKLILVLGLGLVYLIGLGWLIAGPLLHGKLAKQKAKVPLLQQIPLAMVSGLVLNYGIVLCVQSLKVSLLITSIISLFGLVCFLISIIYSASIKEEINSTMVSWLGFSLVCLLYLSPILFTPLQDWDARSIWFFHAKVIYYASSIGPSTNWQSLAFMPHPDYPKLVPILAAQVTTVFGIWNEYLPKISLFYLFVPAMGWLFTFRRRSFSFFFLLAIFPFIFGKQIWNGYMDGYLALYFSISMLLLGRYFQSSNKIDLISGFASLFIPLYLKNEGSLVVGSILCAAAFVFMVVRKEKYIFKIDTSRDCTYLISIFLALLPLILWTIYKRNWGLHNDLLIGFMPMMKNLLVRLSDGSYKVIFHHVFANIRVSLLIFGVLVILALSRKTHRLPEGLFALTAAGIYCVGIVCVYLCTPHELYWHLDTSISRTMLSVNSCIMVGSYFVLDRLEEHIENSK